MKLSIFIISMWTVTGWAQTENMSREDVGSPPDTVSRDQSESREFTESSKGLSPKESKKIRTRAESMGGAPNMGAGMGTGTGAGSTVGNDIEDDDEKENNIDR